MAPADRRTQRPVAARRAPVATGQQPEAVVQPQQHLLHRQGPQPSGSELQRQRNPVEAVAELPHGPPLGLRRLPARPHPPSPLREQLHRVSVPHRGQREHPLPGHPQRAAPGREHLEPGGPAQQLGHQARARLHEVLEAVDHQQRPALAEVLDEDRARRPAGVVGQLQGVDQGVLQQAGIAYGGQLGHQDPVAVPFLPERGGPDDAPGLAHARHPDDGDEPGLPVQQRTDSGEFVLTAHEGVQLGGEAAGSRCGAGVRIAGIRRGVLQASHETRSVLA